MSKQKVLLFFLARKYSQWVVSTQKSGLYLEGAQENRPLGYPRGEANLLSSLPCTSQWLMVSNSIVCAQAHAYVDGREGLDLRERPASHGPSRKFTKSDIIYLVFLQTTHFFSRAMQDVSFYIMVCCSTEKILKELLLPSIFIVG